MATSPMVELLSRFRRTALLRDGADGKLLEEYVSRRDEAALAALVLRHGPMVWGVCRRVLRDYHDAEDAFQATFLVLVRRAESVRPREMVANWLYGVARQTALKARATVGTRKGRERQTEIPEPAVAESAHCDELLTVLDEELSRLPDRYRAVVVLCELEGKTRKDAARHLGVPEGTVAGWSARARKLLAERLARRGVALSGGALAAILSASEAAAGVPAAAVANTIKAAILAAAGQAAATGVISVNVAALTEGVLKTMLVSKLKTAVGILLVVAMAGFGAGLLSYGAAAAQQGGGKKGDATAQQKQGVEPKPQEDEGVPLGGILVAHRDDKPAPKDLGKIQPPGGVPLPVVGPKGNYTVEGLNKVKKRLEAVPEKDLEKWVVELERIMDKKLKDGLPSPRQVCRTDFVIRLSAAFDDLAWDAKAADKLFDRARTMPASEAKAWKKTFEGVLKKEIGQTDTEVLDGGPSWAVPLVLVPVEALHEKQKYSAERGKKYRARLKQLTADDVSLWKDEVDQFGGTKLDAAVNIILLDEYFDKEKFQRDKLKAAIKASKK